MCSTETFVNPHLNSRLNITYLSSVPEGTGLDEDFYAPVCEIAN